MSEGGETVIDDSSALTRRERRLASQRARRVKGFGGWLGYGSSVAGIILVTAFLALGAGPTPTPTPVARTSHPAQPVASAPDVTTTTKPAGGTTVTSPATSPTAPTSTTSTTTAPLVAAAATPEASTPTP